MPNKQTLLNRKEKAKRIIKWWENELNRVIDQLIKGEFDEECDTRNTKGKTKYWKLRYKN